MDALEKKTALRMIPYGLYVLTAGSKDHEMAAATVNWVTQTSFEPPLVAVAVKAETTIYALAQSQKRVVLNMLGKSQKDAAFAFFKPTEYADGQLNGQNVTWGNHNIPVLADVPAAVELEIKDIVPKGDHHLFLGEVVDVYMHTTIEGRPDDAILEMRDLGGKVFYGG